MNYSNYFIREIDDIEFKKYIDSVKEFYNIHTFNKRLTKYYDLFNHKNYKYYIAYTLLLLKLWIMENEDYNSFFIENLFKIIRWYKLNDHLTFFEKKYIIDFSETVFNKKRNLKKLMVDFPLEKKSNSWLSKFFDDNIYYFFDNIKIFNLNEKKYNYKYTKLYISEYKIIFSSAIEIMRLDFKNIEEFKLCNGNFYFKWKKNKFIIEADDRLTSHIYVSFQRLYYDKYK